MLLLAGLGPGGGAGEVTDRLDDGAFEGVVLPGGLAAGRCPCQRLLTVLVAMRRVALPGLVGVRGVGHCEGRGRVSVSVVSVWMWMRMFLTLVS